jgi:hypothetical protein
MSANSESGGGTTSYGVDMSISFAHLLVTLIFQKIYARETIGDPSHRHTVHHVRMVSFFSKGALVSIPRTGITQVRMVLAEAAHP